MAFRNTAIVAGTVLTGLVGMDRPAVALARVYS
jgi:hypothetical protein